MSLTVISDRLSSEPDESRHPQPESAAALDAAWTVLSAGDCPVEALPPRAVGFVFSEVAVAVRAPPVCTCSLPPELSPPESIMSVDALVLLGFSLLPPLPREFTLPPLVALAELVAPLRVPLPPALVDTVPEL